METTTLLLPFVDVVIAARNEEQMLAKCLQALAVQDYPTDCYAVHVVDNGSSDRTVEIAKQHSVHILHTTKRGAAAARNYGIAQTQGELVAFLDAHCVVSNNWITRMTSHFVRNQVGGCQSSIENCSVHPGLQRYFSRTKAYINAKVVENTVSGKRTLYPWILTGNCMYRRTALQETAEFNEQLVACEDVDLAWRVVLQGYQLEYEPSAFAVHYDGNSWKGFIRKHFVYARGAAQLSRMYALHGTQATLLPPLDFSRFSLTYWLCSTAYGAGFFYEQMRNMLGCSMAMPPHPKPHITSPILRPRFHWHDSSLLQLSPSVIYWCREGVESVVVDTVRLKRMVLDSVANFIWLHLADEHLCRQSLIDKIVETYKITPQTAAHDLDEFIDEMVQLGILQIRT